MSENIRPETPAERAARLVAEKLKAGQQSARARALRAQIEVLDRIKRDGVYWPGDLR